MQVQPSCKLGSRFGENLWAEAEGAAIIWFLQFSVSFISQKLSIWLLLNLLFEMAAINIGKFSFSLFYRGAAIHRLVRFTRWLCF